MGLSQNARGAHYKMLRAYNQRISRPFILWSLISGPSILQWKDLGSQSKFMSFQMKNIEPFLFWIILLMLQDLAASLLFLLVNLLITQFTYPYANVDAWVGSIFVQGGNECSWRCWGIFCLFKLRSSRVLYFVVRCVQLCYLSSGLFIYGKDTR